MKRILKRAGAAAFLFFLIKGLVWLALLASATLWAGGAGPAGPGGTNSLPRPETTAPTSAEGGARLLPMHLDRAARVVIDTSEQWFSEAAGPEATPVTRTTTGLAGLLLLLVALRIRACRHAGGNLANPLCGGRDEGRANQA